MISRQLETFLKTADAGSFGKAADALYISTPAVVQQINLLEDSLGFRVFDRSNRGVKLTPAGRSLYEDAKTLLRLADDAVKKARRIAESGDTAVRIGTSLLYKCRMLPDLWTRVSEYCPDLRIEIVPMREYDSRDNVFSKLGRDFDLFEGIWATAWKDCCRFLELSRTPVCCAVARNHRLAGKSRLTAEDLDGETLVMPSEGVSAELVKVNRISSQPLPVALRSLQKTGRLLAAEEVCALGCLGELLLRQGTPYRGDIEDLFQEEKFHLILNQLKK